MVSANLLLRMVLAMGLLACWSPPAAADSHDPTTGDIPLPAVVAQGIAVLQDYAALGRLRRSMAITEREVVFLRDEQDLRDLVDALVKAAKRGGPQGGDEGLFRDELLNELRSQSAFTLSNQFPVVYNGASARWQAISGLVAQGKADRVKYVIAADLAHEAIHARGIRDELIACRAQLEVLNTFIGEGRYYLAAEIRTVQQQCREYKRKDRYGRRFWFEPPRTDAPGEADVKF